MMNRWYRPLLAAIMGFAAAAAHAAVCPTTGNTCNATISSGNITAAIEALGSGTLCLNAGTYFAGAGGSWADPNSIGIGDPVTVCGLGASPANTTLTTAGTPDFIVKFTKYHTPSPNNAMLTNVTISGANGGVQILDYTSGTNAVLSGITLKNVIVDTHTGNNYGIYLKNTDKINIDGATVTSGNSGFLLQAATNTLLMNSSVVSTAVGGSNALAVIGGSNNVIVGNTLGSPKSGGTYPIKAGGVNFYDTTGNRFENNVIQGQHDDGLDFTASGAFSGQGVPAAAPIDNYAGKNTVISTGLADGLGAGSGIWSNCSADRTWIYGNDAHGSPECGVCTWQVKSNMVLGNQLHDHGIAGIVNSGGSGNATDAFCTANGGAFRERPVNNFLLGNYIYYNKGDQITIWDADSTTVSSNLLSGRNGFGGATRTNGLNSFGQAAFAFNEDRGINNNGVRIVANISHDNIRGLQSDDQHTVGIEFAYNRMFQSDPSAFSRYELPGSITSTNWDGGSHTGGNFWTLHAANGDPSASTPYGSSGSGNPALGVYDSGANTTGKIVDRYPFQHENLGKGYTVTVSEPRSGLSFARNTKRTVRWYAPGCAYMDLALDGITTLLTNTANTGYAIVTIPGGASLASHNIVATCKDSSGGSHGSGSSPSFTVTDSTLQLLAPGRDDVFNAGTQIAVGWKKGGSVGNVSIQLSTDGGASFPTSLGTFSGTSARVTLPSIGSTAYAVLRVTDGGSLKDDTDGVFAIRGASGAGFTNVQSGRNFTMGQLERLEWASPQNSRAVTLTASVGGVVKTIATDLPDRGNFDWIVPEWATTGTLTLSATFKNAGGSQIGSTINNVNGNAIYPTVVAPPNPPRLYNISTRGQILTGADVMIGGFVISGSTSKTVVVRAIGPSLASFGITGTIADPTLSLTTSTGTPIASNDNWQTQANSNDVTRITNAGLAPSNPFESALIVTLNPGAYTAMVSGMNGSTGVGLVEVYEIDHPETDMINISTRGHVGASANVMIGGFVVTGSGPQNVVVRAIGPSLASFGITTALQNPTLAVTKVDGTPIASNDDWQTDPNAAQVQAAGFAPSNTHESALYLTLQPGAYTAIVSGVSGGTGTGLVEVYTTP